MPSGVVVRERPLTPLQGRFIKSGFEDFSNEEIIELLLSLVLPHRKCRGQAKKFIEHFKTLRKFLAASP